MTLDYDGSTVLLSASTIVFACRSKACAPPPVGAGGSEKMGGTAPSESAESFTVDRRVAEVWTDELRSIGIQHEYSLSLMEANHEERARMKVRAAAAVSSELLKSKSGMRSIKEFLDCVPGSDCDDGVSIEHVDYLVQTWLGREQQMEQSSMRERLQWHLDLARSGDSSPAAVINRDRLKQLLSDVGETLDSVTPERLMAHLVVRRMIDAWADSSWDSAFSITSQKAAQERNNLPVNDFQRRQEMWRELEERGMTPLSVRVARAVLDAEYAATQRWLKDNLGPDVRNVTLFRGVTFKSPITDGEEGDIEMNPLSSWTIRENTAYDFTGSDGGTVFAMEVPVEMIQSTPFTGRGCLNEQELIVIGYPSRARVTDVVDE